MSTSQFFILHFSFTYFVNFSFFNHPICQLPIFLSHNLSTSHFSFFTFHSPTLSTSHFSFTHFVNFLFSTFHSPTLSTSHFLFHPVCQLSIFLSSSLSTAVFYFTQFDNFPFSLLSHFQFVLPLSLDTSNLVFFII